MSTLRPSVVATLLLSVLAIAPAGAATPAADATPQPELKALKADFVPGEKTLLFDDFSDLSPGDPPTRFKARGAAPELMAGERVRQLTFTKGGSLFPNLTGLPADFTFEMEALFTVPVGNARFWLVLNGKGGELAALSLGVVSGTVTVTTTRKVPKPEELGRASTKPDLAKPLQVALWLQKGRLRVFVNGDKLSDANQVELPPISGVELRASPTGVGVSIGLRSVRFAESTPDFSQVIAATGRYVSYGIRFDTDSARLKPESAAILQSIARALAADPALQLRIEGHTDDVGDAAHNLDLSKRRAAAVKSVLVTQFGIDAARLTTDGLGESKPLDANATPQGRAQNRRVEFVRP